MKTMFEKKTCTGTRAPYDATSHVVILHSACISVLTVNLHGQ